MVCWSNFKQSIQTILKQSFLLESRSRCLAAIPKRSGIGSRRLKSSSCQELQTLSAHKQHHDDQHHFTLHVRPSRFQWNKFKDLLHYHVMLGVLPILLITLYTNIFVGPAKLEPLPEGHRPRYWEYHRHPISRFVARYMHPSPQQEYEKALHHLYEENEKAQIRQLELQIRAKMSENNDYQAYYYRPILTKYHRVSKEAADYMESLRGN